MVRIFRIIAIVYLFFSNPYYGYTDINVSISPTRGHLSTRFVVEVIVQDENSKSIPSVLDEGDFTVRYIGPSQEVSYINGQMSQVIRYRFSAAAKKEGTLKIPTFVAEGSISGKVKTSLQTVEVSQSAHDTTKTEDDEIRVESQISKNSSYVGEQLILTTTISSAVALQNLNVQIPTSKNFWLEEIKPYKHNAGGNLSDNLATLTVQSAIFPLTEGNLKIPPTIFSAETKKSKQLGGFDPFDMFNQNFFQNILQGEPVTLATKEVNIDVSSLPKVPPEFPDNLPILIGKTQIEGSIDKTDISPTEEGTLTIRVKSIGNLQSIRSNISLSSKGISIVEDKDSITKKLTDGFIESTLSKKFILSPKENGELTIEPIKILVLDPATGNYSIIQTDTFKLNAKSVITTQPTPLATVNSSTETSESSDVAKEISKNYSVLLTYLIYSVLAVIFVFFIVTAKKFFRSKKVYLPNIESLEKTSDIISFVFDFEKNYLNGKSVRSYLNDSNQIMAFNLLEEHEYGRSKILSDLELFNKVRLTVYSTINSLAKKLIKSRF